MRKKAFSVGVRAEHLQSDVDEGIYKKYAGHRNLRPAQYNLSMMAEGRGVYTFCMCPGGTVVNASSESGRLCIHGMSTYGRSKILRSRADGRQLHVGPVGHRTEEGAPVVCG